MFSSAGNTQRGKFRMSDAAQLDDWQPKFESWVEFAKPLLPQGKAREAFAEYPWFTTVGDPFVTLSKPASECRFGLVTTGGYSIDGEQEPFTGLPTFGDEVPGVPKDSYRRRSQQTGHQSSWL